MEDWKDLLKESKKCVICGEEAGERKSKLDENRGKPICDRCFEEDELPRLRRFWANKFKR